MRVQLTAIEKLNVKHPGLQLDVDTLLKQDSLLEDIQRLLWEKYGEKVSHQLVSKYKQKRWLPSLQRIQDRMERSQAAIRLIQQEGDSDFARAYIFEQLDEAARRGDRVDPAVLLREQRLRTELQLRFQQLEQANRRLELGLKTAVDQLNEATPEAGATAPKPFDPQEVIKIITEAIGTGQPLEERIEPA